MNRPNCWRPFEAWLVLAGLGLPARDPAAGRVKLPKRPAPAVSLFVAPGGADGNSGTKS